jgi:hypothetical protein
VRDFFNNELIDKMFSINILLLIVTIFIVISLKVTGAITFGDVLYVFIENIITFIFVGAIEVTFFLKIASQYVPAPPSLIYTSFFDAMRKNIN